MRALVPCLPCVLVQFWQPTANWSMQSPVPNDARLTGVTAALQVFYLGTRFPLELHGTNGIWATMGR